MQWLGATVSVNLNLEEKEGALTWEYKVVEGGWSPAKLEEKLNEVGTEEWEAVGVAAMALGNYAVLFKRLKKPRE